MRLLKWNIYDDKSYFMKVLFISQEVAPYVADSTISLISRQLPQLIQEKGNEVRIFMPRFGTINERRGQLHEVIRLSGLNMIIDGQDHPLIIKVASIQSARMQVYFIDNEEFFSRKAAVEDANNNFYEDNDERSIFFARGTLETVRRLRWKPDVIHCHGWFSGVAPLYVKKAFKEDPLFSKTKIVYSFYDERYDMNFSPNFRGKAIWDGITRKDTNALDAADYMSMQRLIMQYSDAFVLVGENVHPEILTALSSTRKPVIKHNQETYVADYLKLYETLLSK